MFTGLIEEVGLVHGLNKNKDGVELTIEAKKILKDLKINDSIACSGICLTVIQKDNNKFKVQIVHETLGRTTAKMWKKGSRINLERSLLPTTRIGGHFVQGHVDNVINIKKINIINDSAVWQFSMPQNLDHYIVQKGSVCLDGISLTIADKRHDYFSVALIPHTLKKTTWRGKEVGDSINIEVDIMAKYIEKILRK
ncbi:MAG: riboflavin synthase [Candidatus Neomarinimicrobiota bacterium]